MHSRLVSVVQIFPGSAGPGLSSNQFRLVGTVHTKSSKRPVPMVRYKYTHTHRERSHLSVYHCQPSNKPSEHMYNRHLLYNHSSWYVQFTMALCGILNGYNKTLSIDTTRQESMESQMLMHEKIDQYKNQTMHPMKIIIPFNFVTKY